MYQPSLAHIGMVRVVDLTEYGHGEDGFAIEEFGYANLPSPAWGIPAWEERGMAHLAGPFATREEAEVALRDS